MKTLAEQIGQTPHLSPLLHRLGRLGLGTPESLRRLVVARGCRHYGLPGEEENQRPDPWRDSVTNAELAVAMLSAAQEFDPTIIRCAAQLLGGRGIDARSVADQAVRERAVPAVRHIAQAGLSHDEEGREFWTELLKWLPPSAPVPEGRLPHRSRFLLETGLVRKDGRLERSAQRIWLRPG